LAGRSVVHRRAIGSKWSILAHRITGAPRLRHRHTFCQRIGKIGQMQYPPYMATMNISLTPQLEKLVHDRVKSGRYTSASEVIRDALRLLDSRDRGTAQLNADVEAGLRQLDAGQSRPFDADAVERITQAGRAKLAALKAGNR
jgi:antitoxin ParD1/3/4